MSLIMDEFRPSQQEISHKALLRARAIKILRANGWENYEMAKLLGISEESVRQAFYKFLYPEKHRETINALSTVK